VPWAPPPGTSAGSANHAGQRRHHGRQHFRWARQIQHPGKATRLPHIERSNAHFASSVSCGFVRRGSGPVVTSDNLGAVAVGSRDDMLETCAVGIDYATKRSLGQIAGAV